MEEHYSTGLTREKIERALIAAGKDLANLEPADLAPLEDFHTMGRLATAALAELASIEPRTPCWMQAPASAGQPGSSQTESAAGSWLST